MSFKLRNVIAEVFQKPNDDHLPHLDERSQIALEGRYPQVYRQQGLRYPAQFAKPRYYKLEELEEIDFTMLHYYVPRKGDSVSYGIPEDHPILKPKQRQSVFHVEDYLKVEGVHKRKIVRKKMMIKSYHRINQKMFWIRDNTKIAKMSSRRPWNIVIDYSLVDYGIEFRPNPMRQIFRFNTQYNTYLNGIKEHLNKFRQRHHMVMMMVPDEIPPMNKFRMATKDFKRPLYATFPEYEHMQMLDLWKWLDADKRKESLLFKYIPERDMDLVDLLFIYKGHVVFLNLGLLNRWVTGKSDLDESDEDIIDDKDLNDEDFTPDANNSLSYKYQKRFWSFLTFFTKEVNRSNQGDLLDKLVEDSNKKIEQVYDSSTEESLPDDSFLDPDTVDDNKPVDEKVPEIAVADTPTISGSELIDEISPTKEVASKNKDIPHEPENLISETDKKIIKEMTGGGPPSSQQFPSGNRTLSHAIDVGASRNLKEATEALQLTAGEQSHWERQAKVFHTLKSPSGKKGETLAEYIDSKSNRELSQESTKIPDMPFVSDKEMLNATIKVFHRDYIRNNLKKDVVKSIASIQRTGVLVTGYEINEEKDVASHYEVHSVQFTPIGGSPSTVHIRIPKVREDGTFRKSLVTYRLRGQRRDKPIRKVSEGKSSLTSYYGKLFITKCARKRFNQPQWMQTKLDEMALTGKYTDVAYGSTSTQIKDLPDFIQAMMGKYSKFSFKSPSGKKFTLDLSAMTQQGDKLMFGDTSYYYNLSTNKFVIANVPYDPSAVLGFNVNKMPVTFAEVKILGEMMPVGFVMARMMGFSSFVKTIGLDPIKYEAGKRLENEENFIQLRFQDEKWVFDKSKMTEHQKLLIAGFLNYEKDLRDFSVYDFDNKEVYGTILQQNGVAVRYERELDLIEEMFVDPMTEDVLRKMNEPTEINGLLSRAVELLSKSHQVDEINMEDMMIKGYERVPGAVYAALVSNLRVFKGKSISYKRRFEMKPDDVMLLIANDPTTEISDEINPIHNTKEKSNITFVGEGGRSRQSMTEKTRMFHDTDLGVVSEASVDSQDIGITTFLTASPKIVDQSGITEQVTPNEVSASNIFSVSSMLAAFGEHDDQKRTMLGGVQTSHRIPIKGAMPNPIRTGYETVIAHVVDPHFAYAAEMDGVIKEKGGKYVILSYQDGREMQLEIGVRIANSKGNHYKHVLICDLQVGEKFKKGDIVVYNEAFFIRDILNPTQVIIKDKTYGVVQIIDNNDTYEDSSAFSAKFTEALESKMVKERVVIVDAKDVVSEFSYVGESVDIDDILMFIEDQAFSGAEDKFGKHSAEVLQKLSRNAPKAGVKGKVVSIDCFYFCEEEDLSPSIKETINTILRANFSGTKTKASDKRDLSGRINEPLKMKGSLLGPGKVAFRFYIETTLSCGAGDKFVFD